MNGFTLQLSWCPQCLAPAEIIDRFVLESTSGPVEHVTVSCLERHRFTTTADHLPAIPAGRILTGSSRPDGHRHRPRSIHDRADDDG
jgi:hypothetical protein